MDTTFVTEHPFQAPQSAYRPCCLAARVSFLKKGHSRGSELCRFGLCGDLESPARTEKAVIRSWRVPGAHFLGTSRLLHLCALPADLPSAHLHQGSLCTCAHEQNTKQSPRPLRGTFLLPPFNALPPKRPYVAHFSEVRNVVLPRSAFPGPSVAHSFARPATHFHPNGLLWHISRKCVTPPVAEPPFQAPPGRIPSPALQRTSTQTAFCGTFRGSA